MTRFSDAALLKGEFAHMAAELRAGERASPNSSDWSKVACEAGAEIAAQEVAKQIFALQQEIDPEHERLEITALTAVGPIRVTGFSPGEGDLIRLNGELPNGQPAAHIQHVSQMALTFTKAALKNADEADDGLEIGFVIFEELKERQEQRGRKPDGLPLRTSGTIKQKPARGAKPARKTKKNADKKAPKR
ncbi:MAG: hypothetical protein AAGF28_05860 [Pseudomonadota bacterium]